MMCFQTAGFIIVRLLLPILWLPLLASSVAPVGRLILVLIRPHVASYIIVTHNSVMLPLLAGSTRHVLRVEWERTCGHMERKDWPGIKQGQMGLASPRDSSTEFGRESRSEQ
jgi:hypothetical protein